jgi:methyl-accepting chemotaxis protein
MDMELSELNRFDRLFDIFTMVSNGNYNIKAEVKDDGDYFDLLSKGVNMMIDNLRKRTLHISYVEDRINKIMDVVIKVGQGDFSSYCETKGNNDIFDALGIGINMMIDDLKYNMEEKQINNL